MSYWFCPNCQKTLGDKEHYTKWYQSPYKQTPGPFIAGHLMNNPNLPIVGVQLNQSDGFYWEYCSRCHTSAHKKTTKGEDVAYMLFWKFILIGFAIFVIGSIIYLCYLSTQTPDESFLSH